MSDYQPAPEILARYADVLVNFALNSGEGVKSGEVVQLVVPDVAKPMALALQNAVLKAGAHPMLHILPTGFDKDFYTLANDTQLTFFPKKYFKERINLIDHQIYIIADPDPHELKDVNPANIMKARNAKKPMMDWRMAKEALGEFTWTIGLWGVPARAAEVELSLEAYWQQIIDACFLDFEDPVAQWRQINQQQKTIKQKLNELKIEWLHVKGVDVDLKLKIGANRIWNAGSGRNIPSFEFFTSPDWRGTEGWISFNQPLYRYGNKIEQIYLEFKAGKVVKATAAVGQDLLQEMIKTKNADKVGEYSLTDKRMSRITHVMAETLFDENIGGPFGNTHLALGMAYLDCFRGDQSSLSKKEWDAIGFNNSAEHTDIISTTDREVTATLSDGSTLVIYRDGMFVI